MLKGENKNLTIVYLLFFISGVAALVYQIVWQRLLTYFTGSDITSISLIVSAYMAGLGLGSLAGGYISDRISQKNRLLFFGLSEALIGVFVLFSKYIFYDYLYGAVTENQLNSLIIFSILFLVFLVPTFLMGASLPLLSKAFIANVEDSVTVIGKLYFVNTLGAAVGAILPIITVRYLGFSQTLWATSILNFLCFAGAVYLNLKIATQGKIIPASSEYNKKALTGQTVFWFAVCCLTGFIAVSFEIVWFRMITVICKPVYITFPVLLCVYITGLALGSCLTRFIPATYIQKAKLFFIIQFFIVLYVLLSIVGFIYAVKNISLFYGLYQYLSSYEVNTSFISILGLYGLIVPFFILIPTVLMGFGFILLQSLLQDDFSTVGRKVGMAQFMNITGSSLGAIVTSYLFIDYIGTANTFKLLIGLSLLLVITVFLVKRTEWSVRQNIFYFLFATCVFLFTLFPSQVTFWSVLHGKEEKEIFVSEDATGIAAVKKYDGSRLDDIYCNGIGQGQLDFSKYDYHVLFGLVPSLLHPSPKDIAIIGLGGGTTLYGASGRSETRYIKCFEIIKPQKNVLSNYAQEVSNTVLNRLLVDPRIDFYFGDARFALKTSVQKYDIIEADALRLNSAFSGNLYSKEYFQLLQARLKPGGYAVTWAPSPRIIKTVSSVFKYMIIYKHILIASDSPIYPERINLNNINTEFTRAYYSDLNIDLVQFCTDLPKECITLNRINENDTDINTDLYPKDEFGLEQVNDSLYQFYNTRLGKY